MITDLTQSGKPNLVILTTPHSEYAESGADVIYGGGLQLHGLKSVEIRTPDTLPDQLATHLTSEGIVIKVNKNVSNLRWAEQIPLSFLPPSLRNNVILIALSGSAPCKFGTSLRKWLENIDKHALWIVSGDMSHYHGMPSECGAGAASTAPYSKSNDARPFEAAVQCWA